jgi:hypothetical protein
VICPETAGQGCWDHRCDEQCRLLSAGAHVHQPVNIMVATSTRPVASLCADAECGAHLQPGEECTVCTEPFTLEEWAERHWVHDLDCGFLETGSCACTAEVHARCCVYCQSGRQPGAEPT